jgi:hypothetical protein
MRDYLSPHLLLRLMRLLLPLVLAVVAVFIAALPFRGLSDLFGDFSAAATLMGVALGAITLISTALDADDEAAISTRGMVLMTRALAALLPVLTTLALWSVVLRVLQYGWTPDRVLAALVAAVLLAYALAYAVPALLGGAWMARIRRANVGMALVAMAAAAIWLTPALNAQRISAQSQVDRFADGRLAADALPLWQLAQEWGTPGKAALARLEAMTDHPDAAVIAERIALARQAGSRFQLEQSQMADQAVEKTVRLVQALPVLPEGKAISPAFFDGAPPYRIDEWLNGCERGTEAQPGCVLVLADLLPGPEPDRQGLIFFLQDAGRSDVHHLRSLDGGRFTAVQLYDVGGDKWPALDGNVPGRVLSGEFALIPSGIRALRLGPAVLVPNY